jgi:hypothetical protein
MVARLLLLALAAGPKGTLAVAISEGTPQPVTRALTSELSALGWKVAESAPSAVRGWAHGGTGHLRLVDNVSGDVVLRHGGTDAKAIAQAIDAALSAWAQKGAPLVVTLEGLTGFDEADGLKGAIGKLSGVTEASEGDFADGRQELHVRYTGSIRDLARAIAAMQPPMEITSVSAGHVAATYAPLRGARVALAGTTPFAEALRGTLAGAQVQINDDAPWRVTVAEDKVTLVEGATGIVLVETKIQGDPWEADGCMNDLKHALVVERQRLAHDGPRVRLVLSGLKDGETEALAAQLSAQPLGELTGGTQAFVWNTDRKPAEIEVQIKKLLARRKLTVKSTGERQLEAALGR